MFALSKAEGNMSVRESDAVWFLAQCKPNSYRIAESNLVRQGFRTFLPMQEETRRARSKFVTQLRPLFPGYLFVALDEQNRGLRSVNATVGITRLVSFGNEPAIVPADLVRQLMARCDKTGQLIRTALFKEGDQVMFTKGPFTDFLAKIESVGADHRVWVLLEIMGGQTRMATKADQLTLMTQEPVYS